MADRSLFHQYMDAQSTSHNLLESLNASCDDLSIAACEVGVEIENDACLRLTLTPSQGLWLRDQLTRIFDTVTK